MLFKGVKRLVYIVPATLLVAMVVLTGLMMHNQSELDRGRKAGHQYSMAADGGHTGSRSPVHHEICETTQRQGTDNLGALIQLGGLYADSLFVCLLLFILSGSTAIATALRSRKNSEKVIKTLREMACRADALMLRTTEQNAYAQNADNASEEIIDESETLLQVVGEMVSLVDDARNGTAGSADIRRWNNESPQFEMLPQLYEIN